METPIRHTASEILNNKVYGRLQNRAQAILRHESSDHRLEAGDLVHEAILRIQGSPVQTCFHDESHFVATVTLVMHHVLIDFARGASSPRRYKWVSLDCGAHLSTTSASQVVYFRNVLRRLAEFNARIYLVVVMRFFWGLDSGEIARALSISTRTIKRDWTVARSWLRNELAAPLPE
ncbi:MAG TPA: ECF-type sigma factor [Bryobacteraceae bacterium]|nr:ECF-type sigma factor [Bryobacteraceae bacterium]